MAGSINSLYLKYQNRIQRYLENDLYYQYMLELIASGKTTVTQFNRVLDKTVDEKWLDAIEGAIPAIHEIIAHPRRFLKTVEDLAPVEKVKKIGPNTIQHLASHTQYISGMRGGTIYPGKLLTVENEESIDLYENRFVNTLIRKLAEFIEKRTGALFWDTGDEQTSLLRMESTVEDDYEIIEYKLDMTVHSKQTYLENDSDKMDIFKRIDRVRRVVADFRQSAFVSAMSDTAPVRSPIQRTNQITKDPSYRRCYELWQFLERYDQVGYSIDVRETTLDFDEDYLFQMYGNLVLNYTVFKSLLEHDPRRVTEAPKHRRAVKPKFVKQIVEEFVDNYDLPDVEIRQVIIEEVTRAQLEIERRTAEQRKAQATREKAKEKELQSKAREKEKVRLEKERTAEKTLLAKEQEAEKARLAKAKEREKAKLTAQKEKAREKAKLTKVKEREKAKLAAQKEKAREEAKLTKEKEAEKARLAKAKEAEKAKLAAQKEKAREKAKLTREKEAEKARLAKTKEKTKLTMQAEQGQKKAKARPAPVGAIHKSPATPRKKSTSAPKSAAHPKTNGVEREPTHEVAAPVAPEPVVPEPVAPEPVVPAPVAPEPVVPEPVAPEPVAPEPVVPEPLVPEPVAPEPVAPEAASAATGTPLLNWIQRRRARKKQNDKET